MKRDGRLEVVELAAEEALVHQTHQEMADTMMTTGNGDPTAGTEAVILISVGTITNELLQLQRHKRLTSTSAVSRS
eukprot:4907956-Amphidinium_carterae.1